MDMLSKSLNADDEEIVPEESPFIVEKGVLLRHVGKEGTLVIPKDVKIIGKDAFKGHAPVNQVVIPRSVKIIKDGAFDNFKFAGIRFVGDLSDWCEMEIGHTDLFSADTAFRVLSEPIEGKMVIPDGVRRIRSGVFKSLAGVEEVVLPAGIESIEEEAFFCSRIKKINLPNGLRKIGKKAFSWSDLREVTIPGTVKEIDKEAFVNGTELKSATFAEGVEKIGDRAFQNTPLASVSFPSSLRRIGEGAFSDSGLTEVQIPANVQTVERKAFCACNNLEKVVLKSGVKEVDECAFEQCPKLTEVIFPGTLTYLGSGAFKGCTKLKKVTFYGSNDLWNRVQKQPHWFDGKSIDVDLIEIKIGPAPSAEEKKPANGPFVDTRAASIMGFDVKGNTLVSYHGKEADVRIPTGILEVAEDAFAGNETIREVILPAGVTTIGANAFGECVNLQRVYFPKSLKEIGWGAFADCSSLQTVTYAGNEVEWFDVSRALFWDARTGAYAMRFGK